jgi:hypothetical protein
MIKPRILVTGATGKTGSVLVAEPQFAPDSEVWRREHAITDPRSLQENRYDRYQHESARAL